MVNAVQPVCSAAGADSPCRDPERDGLPGREHSMLRNRQCHQSLLDDGRRGER